MKVTGFVDRGIPKVKIHHGPYIGMIMTLRQYAHVKAHSLPTKEVSALIKTISDAPRIAQVASGGKERRAN